MLQKLVQTIYYIQCRVGPNYLNSSILCYYGNVYTRVYRSDIQTVEARIRCRSVPLGNAWPFVSRLYSLPFPKYPTTSTHSSVSVGQTVQNITTWSTWTFGIWNRAFNINVEKRLVRPDMMCAILPWEVRMSFSEVLSVCLCVYAFIPLWGLKDGIATMIRMSGSFNIWLVSKRKNAFWSFY